jgi:7-alpha-hydroxysteroid dehydrogenase
VGKGFGAQVGRWSGAASPDGTFSRIERHGRQPGLTNLLPAVPARQTGTPRPEPRYAPPPVEDLLDRFRLTGRVAVVTGAGRGIGAAVARALAVAGADVALTARTREQLDAVADDIRAAGRRAVVVPGDVNDTTVLARLVETAVAELGRVDVVVNNAGGTAPRAFLDTSEGYLERSFHFNVTTAFALTKYAAPHMLDGDGGAVVNISSAMGRLRDRGFVAYGTAKAALAHMTRLMAADLAPRIRVNGIAVGSVATSALETVLTDDAVREEMVGRTPLRRLGEPDDIALCALFLASPAASFVTGKIVEVDGGLEEANLALGLPDL